MLEDMDHFFIRAGWLIDGGDGPVRKGVILEVSSGIIQGVNPDEKQQIDSKKTVDLFGCTILPGLIDSHVHLFLSGTDDRNTRDLQLAAGYDDSKEVIAKHIRMHLRCGVVAVRDGGDRCGHALRYRNEFLKKAAPFLLKAAGRAWYKPGRYGKLIGRSPFSGESLADAIKREKEPVDHVKIVNSGVNSLFRFGKTTLPQFEFHELKAAVLAANSRNLDVMTHANGPAPVEIAIDAGCRSIEHGFFMGLKNLQKMADKGVIWVPTVFTMKAYAEYMKKQTKGIDPADVPRRNLEHQLTQLSMAKKLGVPVALGTDAGSPGVNHGVAVIEELKLLMEAGYSLTEAIQSATLNGARVIGFKNHGTLEKGKSATFIAVKGEPSRLPDSLREIEALYIYGDLYEGSKRA